MSGKSSKAKGGRGEREAIRLLEEWLAPVHETAGAPMPDLKRNLMQSREGGYDLVGIDWLALEVKRQEGLNISGWWRQAVRQAGEGQTPFLMYKQNFKPWGFRVRFSCAHCGPADEVVAFSTIDADLKIDAAKDWLQRETWFRLTGKHW